jgi:hypothetical protein
MTNRNTTTNGTEIDPSCNLPPSDDQHIENLEEIYNSLDPTSSGYDEQDDYQKILPDKINVFRKLNLTLLGKADPRIRQNTIVFLQIFAEIIIDNRNSFKTVGTLPSLIINMLEDGSVLVEWGFKDFKIGFSFELNDEESSWYIVTNEKFQDANASGRLIYNSCKDLLLSLLRFVASNT